MAKKDQKTDIASLIDREARAMESAPDVPVPDSSISRGNRRSKTLQVRLNPEELEELESLAAARGLPTSTLAREAILRLINPESRSAAANRVVEEFARYIDAVGEPSRNPVDIALNRMPGEGTSFAEIISRHVAETSDLLPNFREAIERMIKIYSESIRFIPVFQPTTELDPEVAELLGKDIVVSEGGVVFTRRK